MEIWKDIKEHEGRYQVSNYGRIRTIGGDKWMRNKILKSYKQTHGYMEICLYSKDRHKKKIYIHRLVAQAFLPNPSLKKTVNHKNGDKTDNRLKNLEWCTLAENVRHAYEIGLNIYSGEKSNLSKFKASTVLQIRKLRKMGVPVKDMVVKFGMSKSNIYYILDGTNWRHLLK